MISTYKRGSRIRPRPEEGRLRPGAASTPGNAGHPTHRKPANGPPARPSGLARGRRRTDSRRFAAKIRALRGEDPRQAHFLRIAFIGASSAAAAFFFLMARRFIPFMAFAFLPPFLIALRIALRIAFAMSTEGDVWRLAGSFSLRGW